MHPTSRVSTIGLLFSAASFLALSTSAALALDRVDFQVLGDDPELTDALRGASQLLVEAANESPENADVFAAARAEYARLLGALYAQGHYSGVIHVTIDGAEAAAIAPLDAPEHIGVIAVTVDPGPAFVFSATAIAPLAPATALPPEFATGQPARAGVVRNVAAVAIEGWRNQGHAKATIAAQDVVANHANQTLAARLTVAPGPRLRFGDLAVTGTERMRPDRVVAIAGLPTGAVFDPAEVDRAAKRLRRTGVFASVAMVEGEVVGGDLLPVTAQLAEQKPRRFSIGAEVATTDGLALSGYWLHRNLFGGAEKLRVDASIENLASQTSGVDYRLGVTLDRPATLTPDTTLGIAAEIAHIDDADYMADMATLGLTASHVFSDQLTARAALNYEYSNGQDTVEGFLSRQISLPIGGTWDLRNSTVNATEGLYLDTEVKPFVGLGGTDSGVRLAFDGRAFHGFGAGDGVVVAARVQGGAVLGTSLLGTARDDLFYSGGGGSVRGQPYQSLGVTVDRGAGETSHIGGTHYVGAQLEARVKLGKSLGLVGFVDAGRVDVGGFFSDIGEWHSGAGIGLRYETGFGPIRLDIAQPVGGSTGDGMQVYVGLGQAF